MDSKVLVVEDVTSIRKAIQKELSKKYTVLEAGDFDSAVNVLSHNKIDLLITDIRMPGKSGLELIEYVRDNYPDITYTLMTAYNTNDYVHFAYKYGIWNIIPKYTFLDLKFLTTMVDKLISKDIFGVEKYFEGKITVDFRHKSKFEEPPESCIYFKKISSDKDRVELCDKIGNYMVQSGSPSIVYQILEELSSNAMIRAPRDDRGNSKYQYEFPSKDLLIPLKNIKLAKEDAFEIGYGKHENTFVIVTRDRFGSLKKEEILKRFDRHIHVNPENGLPFGLSDSHGRGLYICREISDNIIFNIKRNVMTEVIAFVQPKINKYYKSLSIYEI